MATKRAVLIQPYRPDVTENLGDNTGQYNDQDIGKGVKYSGDAMVAVADGDEIVGFVTAVEPGTKDGFSIGAVRKEGRVQALDTVGNLAVGALVVASTAGTLGTYALQQVKTGTPATYKWIVVTAATGAGGVCVLERV
jgi:hypothetical protein